MELLLFIGVVLTAYVLFLWVIRSFRVGNYGNKYVFITGCDSGFGFLLTQRLDKLGMHVFAGCLTEQGVKAITQTCSRNVVTIEMDVTKETSVQQAKKTVMQKLPKNKGLWAIVNNAGIAGDVGPTEWLTMGDFDKVLRVNLYGVILVTQTFLPLVRKESGRIVNMASITARLTVATAPYCTSKFGVEGYSDTIRRELYWTGVKVSIIEPGFFNTGIVDNETIERGFREKYDAADKEVKLYYGEDYKETFVHNSQRFLDLFMSPRVDAVVSAYTHAVTARFPKARYVVGWDANTVFRVLWNMPEWLSDFLITRAYPLPASLANKRG